MSDEEFVRANCDDSVLDPSSEGEHIFFHVGDCAGWNFATWSSAAAYVRERLEQIRLIEEERAMLCGKLLLEDRDFAIMKRILARLDAAQTDLKRGMKPTP